MTPKVSVIIPVYNVEKYLRQCLDSVVNQTLKDIEIVCVNDGSTDGSLEVLRDYEKKDKRFVILNQKNQGAGAARNDGLKTAKGEYVYFLDGDDYIETDAFNVLLKEALQTGADITLFSFVKFNSLTGKKQYDKRFENDKFKNLKVFSRISLPNDILNITTSQAWNKFYKHSFIKDNRIEFQNLKTCNDIYFSYLSMILANKITFVDKPFIVWREIQKDNMTASRGNNCESIFAAYEKLKIDLGNIFKDDPKPEELINEKFAEHFRYEYQFVDNDKAAEYISEAKRLLPERYFSVFLDKILKVAVIVPVYNVANYLRQCLDSVINQTLKEIEIVCVNDGSTDNSLEILREYEKKDKRFTVIDQKNAGLSASRNAGLDVIKSKYVIFLDSDDYIHENLLHTCYHKIVQGNADVVVFGVDVFAQEKSDVLDERVTSLNNWVNGFNKETGLYKFDGNILGYVRTAWSKLYRMDIISRYNLRFPSGLINEDEYWHWCYFSVIKAVNYINEKFYYYRIREGSIIHQRDEKFTGVFDELLIHEQIYNFLNKNGLYDTYKKQFEGYHSFRTKALIDRCRDNEELLKKAKTKIKEMSEKLKINNPLENIELKSNSKNKNIPKISVILPVYNAEKYLRQCLDSILNQTLKDIEIICIDDGSADNSFSVLEEYTAKDSRFKIFSQKNAGSGVAKNTGINIANGEYIGFVDSDDWISPDYFEVLYKTAKDKKADISATGNVVLFYEDGSEKSKDMGFYNMQIIKSFEEKSKLIIASGVVWNKIYKKDFLNNKNIRFSEIQCTGEDNAFNIAAIITSNFIAGTKIPKYFYRQRNNSQVFEEKTEKHLQIIDIYKEILTKKTELNLSNKWIDVIYKRMKLDFSWHYRDFNLQLKKEFLNRVEEKFPGFGLRKEFEMQNRQLIVSLTSYPARIKTVHQVIDTLLSQTKKADEVVLWLADSQFPNKEKDLPFELLDLTKKGLTISWCEDIKSYKKLIPALKKYPDSIIVTADDDNIYEKDWLKKLHESYLKNPQVIHCHRASLMTFRNCKLRPYREWKVCVPATRKPSFLNFLTGVGGVLYPPNVFYKDVADKELFMNLSPHGDDIWFWAMAVLNGKKIKIADDYAFRQNLVDGTQESALWHKNHTGGRNDEQLRKVFKKYPAVLRKIRIERTRLIGKELFSLRWIYCTDKEVNHKVFRIFGLKIKIRNDKRGKIKKNLKSFFESLAGAKNVGNYKVFSFLFLKIKTKNKHKILLAQLEQNQKQISALNNKLSFLDKNIAGLKNQKELSYTHKEDSTGYQNLDYTNIERFEVECLAAVTDKIQGSEMDNLDRMFLNGILRKTRPQKIVEFGVANGGSAAVILNAIKDINGAKLYSLDYNTRCYRNNTKNTGWMIEERFSELAGKWELKTGGVCCKFLDSITNNGKDKIDVCLLDTVHFNPGEFLNILEILPYMKKNGIIIIHDTALQTLKEFPKGKEAYTCGVLLNTLQGKRISIRSKHKMPILPNIGAIVLCDDVESLHWALFANLALPWNFYPFRGNDYDELRSHFSRHYAPELVEIFTKSEDFYKNQLMKK